MERLILIALVVGFCLVLSFLFSGMEAGVLALSRLRIRQLMRAGNRSARVLHGYLESPENFLWTILVGNTLANFVAVGLVAVLLHQWLQRWPALLVVSFLAVMFLFYAFCELLPKMLFRMFPNRLCLALAGPFRFIHLALVAAGVADDEAFARVAALDRRKNVYRTLVRQPGGNAPVHAGIRAGADFGGTADDQPGAGFAEQHRAQCHASRWTRWLTVTTQTPMAEALKVSREGKVSRLPVWRAEGGQRRIVGIVSLRAVLYQADLDLSKTAGDYVKPALYLEEEMRLEAALKRMQRSGQRLAIVLGRDQREIGIVSLQDILKVIFGEVRL